MRITFSLSAAIVGAGLISRYIGRRISDACDWETYDFCADAGFAWEAMGAFLYLGAATCIFVLLLTSAVRFLRNRLLSRSPNIMEKQWIHEELSNTK